MAQGSANWAIEALHARALPLNRNVCDAERLCHTFESGDIVYAAVNSSKQATFDGWGIVQQRGFDENIVWTCRSCPSNVLQCPHVTEVRDGSCARPMGAAAFKAKFDAFFDERGGVDATGARRLTCISRTHVPEEHMLQDYARVEKYRSALRVFCGMFVQHFSECGTPGNS